MNPTAYAREEGHVSAETSVWLPRIPKVAILGIGGLMLLWLWAAFVRGQGSLGVRQFLPILAVAGSLIAARWIIGGLLRRSGTLPSALYSRVLEFGFCAFLLLGVFLPEYLLGKPPSLLKSLLLFGFTLLLYAGIALAALHAATGDTSVSFHSLAPGTVLFLGCVGYFLLTSWFALAKLQAFGYVGQDIAYFTQCLYTTLHGHLFYSNMYHDLLYGKPVSSDFAGHNQLVLFVLLPFYLLHKSASTLLIVRNVFVVLCAWPVYLISRRIVSPRIAVVATFAFLLAPAVVYQNLYDFAPLSLAGFPLLFAVYFFLESDFKLFVVAVLMTQIVREDLVFAVFGLGLLALWQRRSVRWIAFPCGFAVVWALLSWKVVFPYFLQGASSAVASCFAYLGSSPGQAIHNLLHHPGIALSRNNLIYVKQLIDPFGGVLFLFNPACLISAPYVAINLLGQGGGCNTAIIYRHYSLIPATLLFVSFLFSVKRMGAAMQARGNGASLVQNAVIFFVLAASLSSTVFVTGEPQWEDLRARNWHAEARQVAQAVPRMASVAVPRYMLPSVANREGLYLSLRLLEYHHPDAQYIVLDKDWARMAATDQWKQNYYALWDLLKQDSRYSVTYDSPNYVVYKLCDGCKTDLPHVMPAQDVHE